MAPANQQPKPALKGTFWPSGEEHSLWGLKLDVEKFALRHDLPLDRDIEDGLGEYLGVGFYLSDGAPILVIDYLQSPYEGTEVYIDAAYDIRSKRAELMKILGITKNDIDYEAPPLSEEELNRHTINKSFFERHGYKGEHLKSKIRFISVPVFTVLLPLHLKMMITPQNEWFEDAWVWLWLFLFVTHFIIRCGTCKWSGLKVNTLWMKPEGTRPPFRKQINVLSMKELKRIFTFILTFFYAKTCPNCGQKRH